MQTSPLPLSFIAEYEYCMRSAYYLFTDAPKSRDENEYIQSGRHVHKKVDDGYKYSKTAKKGESSVRVYSKKFRIIGKMDILEFLPNNEIIPVELKRGKKRKSSMHEMQLALMAVCLQEMFPKKIIKRGAVFFTEDRQKHFVDFTPQLIKKAENLATKVTQKIDAGLSPQDFPMQKDDRCIGCCFYSLCYL